MKHTAPYLGSFFVGVLCSCVWSQTSPSSSDLEQRLDRTNGTVVQETHQLQYNLKAGERLAYRVEHLATVDTTVQGNRQTSKSRSISTKVWQVQQVDADGKIHLAHSIEDVDMWSQVDGRQPVQYQSRKDKEAPLEYEKVAQTVGKQLSVVMSDCDIHWASSGDNRWLSIPTRSTGGLFCLCSVLLPPMKPWDFDSQLMA